MILHIDMDAFFASVEQLDHPQLKGKPVIVGGQSDRGVVAAASYEARRYGIHSAMPIFRAKEKCPAIIIVPPRKDRYKEISIRIMTLLHDFSPLVEPVSIDEAYVDVSGCERLFGPPRQIAATIKKKIKDTIHLTCSVGIAPNKFLAKIASDMDKPNGMTVIEPDAVAAFIETLPIRKVPGVGQSKLIPLELLGILTLGDVRKHSEAFLGKKFGKFGVRLKELSRGIDHSAVTPASPVKSISSEETFAQNTSDREILSRHLLQQADEIGRELRKKKLKAKTITIKIKDRDFKQITRSSTLPHRTQCSKTIYAETLKLLDNYTITKRIRLIGVGVSGLSNETSPEQRDLFGQVKEKNLKWEKVDRALDSVIGKFGGKSVTKAALRADELKK